MEHKDEIDRIELAIQQLNELQKEINTPHHDHSLHLSNLISQLETLKGDENVQQLEPPTKSNDDINENDEEIAIRKELKEIKKQNFITQCLVSVLIVITVTWQLSEVSLILKVKDGIRHPFKTFGSMLKGVFKGPNLNIVPNGDNKNSTDEDENGGISVKIPELPHLVSDSNYGQ